MQETLLSLKIYTHSKRAPDRERSARNDGQTDALTKRIKNKNPANAIFLRGAVVLNYFLFLKLHELMIDIVTLGFAVVKWYYPYRL